MFASIIVAKIRTISIEFVGVREEAIRAKFFVYLDSSSNMIIRGIDFTRKPAKKKSKMH